MDAFVGEIRMFSFGFAPQGWAQCEGQILPISQNQALFSLIGPTYGGDGVSTFALPDLQNRAPLGQSPAMPMGMMSYGEKATAGAQTPIPPTLTVNFCICLTGQTPQR
jgi:microcystin-dependent protein